MGDANPKENAKTQANIKPGKGGVIPPVDKRFGQPNGNPRGRGFWDITATPRYKLERMLTLDKTELEAILNDDDAPLFERRLARSLLTENDFRTTEAMINQVYGAPKQVQETKLEAEVTGVDVTFRDESRRDG